MSDMNTEITQWLAKWETGNQFQLEELPKSVYQEIRSLAAKRLSKERNNHTLQPTTLVNEVFLLLMNMPHVKLEGKTHFIKLVARMMRNILVDYSRRRRARGGLLPKVPLDQVNPAVEEPCLEDVVAVHQALEKLTELDERLSIIVDLRYFGGLTVKEVAKLLHTSETKIEREWQTAKTFLKVELTKRGNNT